MLRSFLQQLLLFLIDVCCRAYVELNLYPIRLQVITQERRPRTNADEEKEESAAPAVTPEDPRSLSYVAWLDQLYKNSPSKGET